MTVGQSHVVYPDNKKTFWDLMCGRLRRVIIDIRVRALDEWLLKGDYANDEQFRLRFQEWISSVWADKDRVIASILAEQAAKPAT